MENRMEFKIYNASPNCFSFAHIRIVWDAARASAAAESFGDVSVSRCLATCSGVFANAADPKKRDQTTGRVEDTEREVFRGGFGVRVLRKDRIAADHP